MSMPASEFVEWQAYFNLYPFSFEADEYQAAKLAYFIYNVSGKTLRPIHNIDTFLSDYVKEKKEVVFKAKSLEQQKMEFRQFTNKLRNLQNKKTL